MDARTRLFSRSAVTTGEVEWPATRPRTRLATISVDWSIVAALTIVMLVGFGFRVFNLGAASFAEDEIHKLQAVRAYDHWDITPNAEHPMLMKVMMYVSVKVAHAWNAAGSAGISEEAALRFPNALFGTLTVIPLYLLCVALFDRRTALLSAALWSVGVNVIIFNRIGKEDTLLVFFMLFAFYFYIRAKEISGFDPKGQRKRLYAAGASFGLMFAAKYFIHFFALNALYHDFYKMRKPEPGEPKWRAPGSYYLLMFAVFLLANPAILFPQVWQYLTDYTSESLLRHSGYLMAGHLYMNVVSRSPFWGTPIYFYLLYFAVKVPLPILVAAIAGFIVAIINFRERGPGFLLLMFGFWIVPFSLSGGKWLRYTLAVMPIVYMFAALGITLFWRCCSELLTRLKVNRAGFVAGGLVLFVFLLLPALSALRAEPFPSLYLNLLGAGRAGYYFSEDEFYDHGLKDTAAYICAQAPPGTVIAHENPGAYSYYMEKCSRTDLKSVIISSPDFKLHESTQPTWAILEPGATYFENIDEIDYARTHWRKIYDVKVQGATAVEVYAN